MENKRGFASRLGFIFSMAAFSIGIGNLWKFPYIVGNNGGGIFLLVYLATVLLVGIPAFLIELTLGRSSQLSPMLGMRRLENKKKTGWSAIGWMGCLAIFIICSYATMIVGGWTGGYIGKMVTGSLRGLSSEELGAAFGSFCGSPVTLIFGALQALLLWFCLTGGIKKGVEKVCSFMLPTLMGILIVLAVYANTLPGAWEGLKWYITPDFSTVSLNTISAAATQVFFSIGVGMCCGFVYGSYIDKDTNLAGSVLTTAVMDTFVAVLAGLVCVPALFAFNIEPTAGPSLIFITLPQLFNAMGSWGIAFGLLFMVCVFFAGFTSILGGSEALVACICDSKKNCTRKKAATIICVAEFLLSIVFTLSFGSGWLSKIRLLGLGLFDFADFIATLCMALGAIAMLAYVICRWKFKKFQQEANAGATGKVRVYNWMKVYIYYIFPVVLAFVFVCLMQMYF